MKVLLLGEYSSLHWTLAQGLKLLGHNVTVASDGDGFKNYRRDIDLARKSSGLKDTFDTFKTVFCNLKNFKNYDVVQLINPCFTQLNVNANAYLYHFLKKHNTKVFLGAFGVDSFWLRACLENKIYKYSEFIVDGKEHKLTDNDTLKHLWLGTKRDNLNTEIADNCTGIVACLYEYYMAYESLPEYAQKLRYISLPLNLDEITYKENKVNDKVKFFIGINKARSEFKGTDVMLKALTRLCDKYSSEAEMLAVESVQYNEYMRMMEDANVVLDQLYSYTPAMNGLLAMAMGKVLVGGGEPEMYDLLGEMEMHPIVNVQPSEEDVFSKLEDLLLNRNKITATGEQSRLFVEKYHDHKMIAKQYADYWESIKI